MHQSSSHGHSLHNHAITGHFPLMASIVLLHVYMPKLVDEQVINTHVLVKYIYGLLHYGV